MSKKYVYLAGPITGQSYEDARHGWRETAHKALAEGSNGTVVGLSPMRQHDALAGIQDLPAMLLDHKSPMDTNKGITAKDRFDCLRSDLIIANFTGSKIGSLGTAIEFGWADANNIPVIMVVEPGNVHNHAMLTEIASFVVPTLEEAIDVVLTLLSEGI